MALFEHRSHMSGENRSVLNSIVVIIYEVPTCYLSIN